MTARIQTFRSSTTGTRPSNTRPVGELFVNLADNQLGVMDATPAPRDLMPIRYFSTTANYAAGAIVQQGTTLYQARAAITAGPFNPASWDQFLSTTQGDARWLPLTGGTLVGPLTLSGPPVNSLHATTKSYVDTAVALKLNLTGGTLTGPLILAGDPTVPLGASTKQYADTKLALSGGTVTGPTTFNGTLSGTAFGWDLGDIPGPIVSQGGIAALKPSAELIFQRNAFAATDGQDFRFRRTPTFTGGTGSNINKVLVVEASYSVGDGTMNWPFLVKASTASTIPTGSLTSAYIQAWRTAGTGQVTGLITDVADFQGTPSSASGQLTGMEWDLNATGADDGANSGRFGGIGIRQMAHAVFANMSSTINSQYTAGIWFGTGINGTAKAYVDSLLCVQGSPTQPTLIRNFLDSRGAAPPPGVTDPVAAVRMSAGHIIDFNGGPALNSPPGRYLQYTTTGTARLRYMIGTVEAFWVDDTANMAVGGTLSATNFSTPGTLYVANVTATDTVKGQTLHATQDLTVDRNVSVTGAIGVSGQITSNSNVIAAQNLFASGNNIDIGSGGSGRIMQMQGGYYLDFNTSTGDTQWIGNNSPLWVMRASDGASYNGTAWVGGHGAYRDVSDERLKTDITPATVGLPEILAIAPINFHRLGSDGEPYPANEIGFSAQNVQPIIPEAVTETGIGLPDALAVASEMILAAAVNAIKTLNERVSALEAT